MTKASFRFSPKILARLGEELNQAADQSIVELVKNAYDADATSCTIELQGVGQPGGCITVKDDGDGMDAEAIRDRWLVLGRSAKTSDSLTRLGRAPAGSKGLGRLAALRMGKSILLESVQRKNSRRKNQLSIDWDSFENAKVVEDVELEIRTVKNQTGGFGTTTKLQNLRSSIGSDEIKRLARSLLLLTDPFGDSQSGFQVQLISPEFKEIESLVKKKYFDDADYHLHAEVNSNGKASVKLLDWQGRELAKGDLSELDSSKNQRLYKAPAATFDVWIFVLGVESPLFSSRKAGKGEIQSWLRSFGGVHVYQDGIRVTPYGNPGNDWLDMNLARAKSPEERPTTNTSIGRIQIKGSGKYALQQKTDRSGFIETDSFQELRVFAQDALDWLARWRLQVAEKRRAKERAEAPKAAAAQKNKVDAAIALAPPRVRKAISDAFIGYERSRNKEADALRREVQLYRTLSTAGITAATFSHESQGNPIKRIELGVTALRSRVNRLVKDADSKQRLLSPLQDIDNATKALATLGIATLSIVKGAKRRVERVDVHETIQQLLQLMSPFLAGMTTQIEPVFCAGKPYLRTSQAAIESIFANLINNSLAIFERAGTQDRKVVISTKVVGQFLEVKVSDNGPGITELPVAEIWLPGITGRPEGTGLGLTIVRDTVKDLGGHVTVVPTGNLGGAEFTVNLPILGS